jgi:ribose transport system substrate-binding protein
MTGKDFRILQGPGIRGALPVLLAILALCLLTFCGGCKKIQDHVPLVGIVLKDTTNPKFQDMERGARKAAQEEKAEVIVLAPEKRDPVKQQQILRDLIEMKIDALCIAPEGPVAAVPGIAKASSLKIPIVLVESGLDYDKAKEANVKIASIVQGDYFHDGEMAGRYIARKIGGKGKVAIMEGVPGSLTGKSKREGFLSAMKNFPNIQIIFTKPAYYKRSRAFEIALALIKDYPDIKGVFCFNDMMAIGISDALVVSGMERKWVLVGFDGTDEGRRAVKEDRIQATFYNNPFQMGKIAVKYALMAYRGEKIPGEKLTKTEFITKESLLLPFE